MCNAGGWSSPSKPDSGNHCVLAGKFYYYKYYCYCCYWEVIVAFALWLISKTQTIHRQLTKAYTYTTHIYYADIIYILGRK